MADTNSPRDLQAEAYVERGIQSSIEVGYGKPDEMYCEWAADAFRKGYDAATERARALVSVLKQSRDKLVFYRGEHSGKYVGGVEYITLIQRIDKAIAEFEANK